MIAMQSIYLLDTNGGLLKYVHYFILSLILCVDIFNWKYELFILPGLYYHPERPLRTVAKKSWQNCISFFPFWKTSSLISFMEAEVGDRHYNPANCFYIGCQTNITSLYIIIVFFFLWIGLDYILHSVQHSNCVIQTAMSYLFIQKVENPCLTLGNVHN